MPVEIRELILRARLVEDEQASDSKAARSADLEALKHELLAECEELIREALLRQQER